MENIRIIQFRGKLKRTGKWAYGNLDIKKAGTAIITPDETPLGMYGEVDPETVGQYTGLKDKNGVKIYERDILHYDYREPSNYEVIFLEGSFWMQDENKQCIPLHEVLEVCKINDYGIEKIGNIYDNPELLEGE